MDFLAGSADIRTLLVKGPAAEQALGYSRLSMDVDVLVEPGRFQDLLDLLCAHGFVGDLGAVKESWAHSVEVVSDEWSIAIDVHRWFPGIDVPADRAFEVLWSCAAPVELAGRPCTTVDRPAHAVLIGLHAARNRRGSRKHAEIADAWAALTSSERNEMHRLAADLGAEPVLGIVLEDFSAATSGRVRSRWEARAHKRVLRIWYYRVRDSDNLWRTGREVLRGLRRRRGRRAKSATGSGTRVPRQGPR
ncbi:hypothetical protein Ksed_18810 [Kytococcus sedentarius DSM 20547]|uniref:Nucleotidyltransferase family protein n=1 Tax=Kytococcus sedentarius (strain ATCC 14392 / DSM 20547 / JCM 11482 / CCUG 33030 / NBRC 15357 / NCTC 11040 / CCM 314 / 541) TaxID=478801 RepID=C7NJV1_KYTSD|nr:hypothetical protein Ksed_18810 [Kytococcus sedentarius DSM 20547]